MKIPKVLLLYEEELLYCGYIFFITTLQDDRIWRQARALTLQQSFPEGKMTWEVLWTGRLKLVRDELSACSLPKYLC